MLEKEFSTAGEETTSSPHPLQSLADVASEPIDFVAIDFETATRNWDSACSIGLAFVRGQEVVFSWHQLIHPPGNQFDRENIEIHGIHPEDTALAPEFLDVWEEVFQAIRGKALVAHNAHFDMSVIKASLDSSHFDYPNEFLGFKYIDTMQMAQEFVPGSRKLLDCAECMDICLEHHHNAECDAIACAEIAIRCIKSSGCHNLGEFCFSREHVHVRELGEISIPRGTPRRKDSKSKSPQRFSTVRVSEIKPSTDQFDESHPFYKKSVAFTGDLSISRKEAMQMVADVGGVVKSSVSKKTDYLILGWQDIDRVGESGMSTKEEKARALNSEGQAHILIIGEEEFLHLLRCEEGQHE